MNNALLLKIGSNIRVRRILKNYSQEFIARELDISQKTYSNIENGKNDISIKHLESLSNLLDCKLIELIDINDSNFIHNIFNNNGDKSVNIMNQKVDKNEIQKEFFLKALESKDKEIEFLKKLIESKLL